jgi:hypothetical protein
MNRMSLRPILAPLVGAALCFLVIPRPDVAARGAVLEQFVAKAMSVLDPDETDRIDIYIQRWSTDEELDALRGKLLTGYPGELLPALEQLRRRAGVVLMPGVQAHGARVRTRTPKNLLFAREIVTPTGRQVIVASDEHLGLGEASLEARREIHEFNLLDIRFGADDTGVGKLATATDVVYSPATKILEVKNYATKPVRLIDVRSEKR